MGSKIAVQTSPQIHEPEPYMMDDAEIRERLSRYKGQVGVREPDVFGITTIFAQAGIKSPEAFGILSGRKPMGKKRRLRLSRAIIMAETGMIQKKNWVVTINPPTRPMPGRMRIRLSSGVPILEQIHTPASAEAMPSFKTVFQQRTK